MPGVNQTSVDEMLRDAEAAAKAKVGGIILFGVPETKDATGSSAWDEKGAVQMGVSALKKEIPELVVITDVCMCEYTDHGHCGVLKNGEVDNDATLELLSRAAISHATRSAGRWRRSPGTTRAARRSLNVTPSSCERIATKPFARPTPMG